MKDDKNFVAWLKAQPDTDNPEGDLRNDLIADTSFKGKTYTDLKNHMEQLRACDGATYALEKVFRKFKRQRK